MKKIVFVSLLFTFFTTCFFGQTISQDEYKIYSTVLQDIHKERKKYEPKIAFVILNETKMVDFESHSPKSKVNGDFLLKNRISVKLENLFPTKIQYWLAEKTEIDEMIRKGDEEFDETVNKRKLNNEPLYPDGISSVIWKYFYNKYPKAYGYYQFSRIGFSPNKRFARIDISGKGAEWNSYGSYILKKVNGKWLIYTAWGSGGIA